MGQIMSNNLSTSKDTFKVVGGGNRSVYELSLEEIYDLLKAMHGLSLTESDSSPEQLAQNRCNKVWKKIAEDRGVDWKSIRPVSGKGLEFFSAINSD